MPFNPGIPLPTDLLSDSQGDLLANNGFLDASFSINHFPFSNGTTDNGKHTFVQMVNRLVVPATTATLEGTTYTKTDATPVNCSQLFYTPDNGGKEYQLTKCVEAQFASFGNIVSITVPMGDPAQFGAWTFLPGGLIMFYGSVHLPGALGTVIFPFGFPSGGIASSIVITVYDENGSIYPIANANTPTNTGFSYKLSASNAATKDLTYIAIGK